MESSMYLQSGLKGDSVDIVPSILCLISSTLECVGYIHVKET